MVLVVALPFLRSAHYHIFASVTEFISLAHSLSGSLSSPSLSLSLFKLEHVIMKLTDSKAIMASLVWFWLGLVRLGSTMFGSVQLSLARLCCAVFCSVLFDSFRCRVHDQFFPFPLSTSCSLSLNDSWLPKPEMRDCQTRSSHEVCPYLT